MVIIIEMKRKWSLVIPLIVIEICVLTSSEVLHTKTFDQPKRNVSEDRKNIIKSLELAQNDSKSDFIQVTLKEDNCSVLDDFPDDLFTNDQRKNGALIFHLLGAIYFFTLLAVLCNDYFLPSVECVCEDLNIPKDVAAATFMAMATIAPEFCTNVISTFVASSNVGMGGILGALMFNVLGVAATGGLAAREPVQLDWWPITRDCSLYGSTVFLLLAFTWDGKISLYESSIMVGLLVIYIFVMIQNQRIMIWMKWLLEVNWNCCRIESYDVPTSFMESNLRLNVMSLKPSEVTKISTQPGEVTKVAIEQEKPKALQASLSRSSINNAPIFMIYSNPEKGEIKEKDEKQRKSLWRVPSSSQWKTVWWAYTWPIKFILTLIIPSPKTYRHLYPVTFILCIICIGLNSYLIVWMISVIGFTLSIPDAIMGLTFLAAGNCTPEAISSILAIRKGDKGVGVSNSLGSSSLDILLSLGVPWLIGNLLNWSDSNHMPSIQIASSGTEYTVILLLISVISLYVVLNLAKYRLQRSVGVVLSIIYLILITISVLFQMNVFFSSVSM